MKLLEKIKFLYNVRKLPQDKPQVYIINELAVAYIQIPKVASRSIRTAITRHITGSMQKNESDGDLVKKFEDLYSVHLQHDKISELNKKYFVFAIVRNPYDRIVSCYKNKIIKNKNTNRTCIFDKYGLVNDASLDEFVDFVCRLPDKYSDRHFRSQSWFLTWQGKLLPSYVGKLESLDMDWNEIYLKSGIDAPPRLNSTDNLGSVVLSPSLKSKIYERYKADFTLFGYEK